MKIYKNKYNIEKNNSILVVDEKHLLILEFTLNEEVKCSVRFMNLSYNLKERIETEYQEIELFEFLILLENIEKDNLVSKLIAKIIRSSLHKKMNKMDNLIDFFKKHIGTNNDLEEILYKKREFQNYLFELKEKYKESL